MKPHKFRSPKSLVSLLSLTLLSFYYQCVLRHLVDCNAQDSFPCVKPSLNYFCGTVNTTFSLTVLPSRNTPSPIDPETIQIPMSYEPDPADLALSSVPGQEIFDPRKCKFSEEELKPQPMIKKARKVFIPDEFKVIWV